MGSVPRPVRAFSHGEREANDWLQHELAKQMKVSFSEFLDFVECTIDGTRYAELITQRGDYEKRL
jgi:hypothetical protein